MMQENTMLCAIAHLDEAAAQAGSSEMLALASYIKETAVDFYLKFGQTAVPKAACEDMLAQSCEVLGEIIEETPPHALPRRLRRIYFDLFETACDQTPGNDPAAVRAVLVRCSDCRRAAREGQSQFESACRHLSDEVRETEKEAYRNQLSQLQQTFFNLLLLYRFSLRAQQVRRSGQIMRDAEDAHIAASEIAHESERQDMAQENWQKNLEKFLFTAEKP